MSVRVSTVSTDLQFPIQRDYSLVHACIVRNEDTYPCMSQQWISHPPGVWAPEDRPSSPLLSLSSVLVRVPSPATKKAENLGISNTGSAHLLVKLFAFLGRIQLWLVYFSEYAGIRFCT